MRLIDDALILSATDLANAQRCERLVQLDRRRALDVAMGLVEPEDADSLAIRKGREFEAQVVADERARVEAAGGRVVDLGDERLGYRERRELLRSAIVDGAELVLQAPLRSGRIGGSADMLVRVDDAVQPGGELRTPHRYEPVEVKYARSVRPAFVLQTCAYAAALEQLCGELPTRLHVLTGDRTRHGFETVEFMAHYRATARRLESLVELELDVELAIVPDRIGHCLGCRWEERCDVQRRGADHLALVANIRRDQIARLADAGIDTLGTLATAVPQRPEQLRMAPATWERLQAQAALQLAVREGRTERPWTYRSPDREGRGFAALPDPDPGDMFFDFEGYPFHETGALEYLWGWSEPAPGGGAPTFQHYWADTVEDEGVAFDRFLAYVHGRRVAHPGMHVYHYAPYEVTQLKRLVELHPEHGEALDDLLRAGVFVDLFAVVSQSMLLGLESYSIKYVEPLYGRTREGAEVASAGASIDEYERWLDTGDVAIRDAIVDYNRDDCESTIELRDWLLERKAEAAAGGIVWAPAREHGERTARAIDEDRLAAAEHLRSCRALVEAAARDDLPDACSDLTVELRADVARASQLLAAMPGWQARERNRLFGELHGAKHSLEADDYVDEPDAMGALELVDVDGPDGRGSTRRTWRGPTQDTLVGEEHTAYDPIAVHELGTVDAIDPVAGTITIKTTRGTQKSIDHFGGIEWGDVRAIMGRRDIGVDTLEQRACEVIDELATALRAGEDPFTRPAGRFQAALSLLARRAPRIAGIDPGRALHHDDDAPPTRGEVADLVAGLDRSTLVIQGPPGTGKTWIAARTIAQLLARGMRVGISSNSHSAIRHLLAKLDEHLAEADAPVAARGTHVAYAFGTAGKWGEAPARVTQHKEGKRARTALADGDAQLLAGTAWTFAGMDEPLDAIFVDEAGQLSLLHTAAIASAASRVVLVGDPQQLAQPAPVAHPADAHRSPLDLLFDGSRTLGPDRGLLLPVTRRMHPDVAAWISETFYDGRVRSHPPTGHHRLECPAMPGLGGTGLRVCEVPHTGCSTSSPAESAAVARIVEALLADGSTVVDSRADGSAGDPRPLTLEDIVVVAPYNRQVACLREALPTAARVGTVDRFQGQEAHVAIWSVTASSRDDVPRGLEFLLSPNRMNVAISRAKTLAVVVASPMLLATRCATIDEMRLVNRLQLFAERASAV